MRRVDASHGAMHLILLRNLHAGRRLRHISRRLHSRDRQSKGRVRHPLSHIFSKLRAAAWSSRCGLFAEGKFEQNKYCYDGEADHEIEDPVIGSAVAQGLNARGFLEPSPEGPSG
jgi:hypothetical protein